MKYLKPTLLILMLIAFLFVSYTAIAQQETKDEKKKDDKATNQSSEQKTDSSSSGTEEDVLSDEKIKDLTMGIAEVWNPADRREPFSSPVVKAKASDERELRVKKKLGKRPGGITGMEIREIELFGIVFLNGSYKAMFVGTDDLPYLLKVGDEIWDAKIREIDMNCVTFEVEMEDKFLITQLKKVPRCLEEEQ